LSRKRHLCSRLGDTLILSPPLVINEAQIGQIAEGIKNGVRTL